MIELITDKSEIATQPFAPAAQPNRILRSSRFKYYIHDGINACRFQLLGELTEPDIADLNGCWRTAKTSLGNRKLILDLRGLNSIDEAGAQWVTVMTSQGAECLRAESANARVEHTGGPRRFRKLLAMVRALRMPSQSSTQAQ